MTQRASHPIATACRTCYEPRDLPDGQHCADCIAYFVAWCGSAGPCPHHSVTARTQRTTTTSASANHPPP